MDVSSTARSNSTTSSTWVKTDTIASEHAQKRAKRAKLSCLECRKRKLSCDRNLPCRRCIRTQRADNCSIEDGPKIGATLVSNKHWRDEDVSHQVVQLQNEVSQLGAVVRQVQDQLNNYSRTDKWSSVTVAKGSSCPRCIQGHQQLTTLPSAHDTEAEKSKENFPRRDIAPIDPSVRFPQMYYAQHFLFSFFNELPSLWPILRETADEWIRPLGIHLKKDKSEAGVTTMDLARESAQAVEDLLPPKQDVDALTTFYLNYVEHIHRIVHIPTFRRQYEDYWKTENQRNLPMTMLILAICSLPTSTHYQPCSSTSLTMRYRHMHKQWLASCDAWLARVGRKRRTLVHHQVACIVYLSKRANMVEKKSWWKLTASLVQDAVMDGVHYEMHSESPYTTMLKRRLWATIRELDLKSTFEFGLPSLLYNISSDIEAPCNVDDACFDVASKDLPPSSPSEIYTNASYQHHSAQSWELRLDISQRLFSPRLSEPLNYSDVLRYTSLIMQAVNAIPSWPNGVQSGQEAISTLINVFLLGTLQQPLLAMHRPHLDNSESQSSLSQTICYNISRDVLLSLKELKDVGLAGMMLFRGDVLLASLTLIRITILQTKRPNHPETIVPKSTIQLLEDCLPLMDESLPRRALGGNWDLMTMCGGIMLLKIHLGLEARDDAKAKIARRFLDMYYKYFGRQIGDDSNNTKSHLLKPDHIESDIQHPREGRATADTLSVLTDSRWLSTNTSDFAFENLDFDWDLDGLWEWDSVDQTSMTL